MAKTSGIKIFLWSAVGSLAGLFLLGGVTNLLRDKEPTEDYTAYLDGFEMTGTTGFGVSSDGGAIDFKVEVPNKLYSSLKKNQTLKGLVLPASVCGKGKIETGKWIESLKGFGLKETEDYLVVEPLPVKGTDDGTSTTFNFGMTEIHYTNVGREFIGVAFIETVHAGDYTYDYAIYDENEYAAPITSYAYECARALNYHEFGLSEYTDEELSILKKGVNDAVDLYHGLEVATDDGSLFNAEVTIPNDKMKVGGIQEITLTIEETFGYDWHVVWKSDNAKVARVENGVVKAYEEGTATLSAYIGGEAYSVTVLVENSDDVEFYAFNGEGEVDGFGMFGGNGWIASNGTYKPNGAWSQTYKTEAITIKDGFELSLDFRLDPEDTSKCFKVGLKGIVFSGEAITGFNSEGRTLIFSSIAGREIELSETFANVGDGNTPLAAVSENFFDGEVHTLKFSVLDGTVYVKIDGKDYEELRFAVPTENVYLVLQQTGTTGYIDNLVIKESNNA